MYRGGRKLGRGVAAAVCSRYAPWAAGRCSSAWRSFFRRTGVEIFITAWAWPRGRQPRRIDQRTGRCALLRWWGGEGRSRGAAAAGARDRGLGVRVGKWRCRRGLEASRGAAAIPDGRMLGERREGSGLQLRIGGVRGAKTKI